MFTFGPGNMYEQVLLKPSEFQFPENMRMLCLGASKCGKTSYIVNVLANRLVLFPKQYDKIFYISPNLSVQHLSHENKLCESIKAAAHPIEVVFESKIPDVDGMLSMVDSEESRVLIILDDFHDFEQQ